MSIPLNTQPEDIYTWCYKATVYATLGFTTNKGGKTISWFVTGTLRDTEVYYKGSSQTDATLVFNNINKGFIA